ncbi:unnamed protein product [Rhodiola kirilowii]
MDKQSPSGERPGASSSVNRQHKVVLQNSRGEKLVGIFHDTGSKELVVICHGFRSSKECIIVVNIAAALEREGISVFRFDFSGHGESEGSFRLGNYLREADDLRDVVEHFSKDQRSIAALVGHSKGGNVVLFHASKYNNVATVVNISGCFDLEARIDPWYGTGHLQQIRQNGFTEIKNKKGKILYQVTRENLKARGVATQTAALSIDTNCRVLIVHGSKMKWYLYQML